MPSRPPPLVGGALDASCDDVSGFLGGKLRCSRDEESGDLLLETHERALLREAEQRALPIFRGRRRSRREGRDAPIFRAPVDPRDEPQGDETRSASQGGGQGDLAGEPGAAPAPSASPAPLPESYSFFTQHSDCYILATTAFSQGDTCNSCWAFATARAMQFRICKERPRNAFTGGLRASPLPFAPFRLPGTPLPLLPSRDHFKFNDKMELPKITPLPKLLNVGSPEMYKRADFYDNSPPIDLTLNPYPLMCALGGYGFCEPQSMIDALNYVIGTGLPFNTATLAKNSTTTFDPANPTKEECKRFEEEVSPAYKVRIGAGRVNLGRARMKRAIMRDGPVVAIMRVSVDFVDNQEALYRGPPGGVGSMRFYDVFGNVTDANDEEDNWMNHFIVIVGWTADDRWIALNSWDVHYQNPPLYLNTHSLAEAAEKAKRYDFTYRLPGRFNPLQYSFTSTSSQFLTIPFALDGKGALEIANRYFYGPVDFSVSDSKGRYHALEADRGKFWAVLKEGSRVDREKIYNDFLERKDDSTRSDEDRYERRARSP